MLFVAVDPIAEANKRVLLCVCIMEIGCYLSQSIRLPRLTACVAMGMY